MEKIVVGITKEVQDEVSIEKTALNVGSGSLKVLATPIMCAIMERASSELMDELLGEEETTVGISLNIEHLAATPVGMKFRGMAELTAIEGRKLTFKVTAYDEMDKIGQGTHERFIVKREKFQNKADSKLMDK